MVVKNVGLITADKQTSKKSKGMASISSITLLIASCQANAKKTRERANRGRLIFSQDGFRALKIV